MSWSTGSPADVHAPLASTCNTGHSMTTFLKTTMLGGVLFLLPLAIVLMVLGYALGLAAKVARSSN